MRMNKFFSIRYVILSIFIIWIFSGCTRTNISIKDEKTYGQIQNNNPADNFAAGLPSSHADIFDGQAAYQHILKQVGFGFRVPGSHASRQTTQYIKDTLEMNGWKVQFQEFIFKGVKIRNVIATNIENNPEILLGTHYDTRALSDKDDNPSNRYTPVTGANDGASGTAVLLELSRYLAFSENNVGLFFFDAEDQGGINGWDWSIGARYYVNQLDYRPEKVIIVDMVGDQDLNIFLEMNSDQTLCAEIWESAEQLDLQKYFINQVKYSLTDDHIPFIEQGIPACLLIDFDYPYWHTTQDIPDKVSPESLQKVGDTLTFWINEYKNY